MSSGKNEGKEREIEGKGKREPEMSRMNLKRKEPHLPKSWFGRYWFNLWIISEREMNKQKA